ncbi:hypothetical protein LIER_34217 [Lithospermum erythrorhizon]|uniref:Uncharacterized protein n=1 Tax=Lithospermum erythrorhizon TaxID=34254 RepID=A0AAV3S147_LITER
MSNRRVGVRRVRTASLVVEDGKPIAQLVEGNVNQPHQPENQDPPVILVVASNLPGDAGLSPQQVPVPEKSYSNKLRCACTECPRTTN